MSDFHRGWRGTAVAGSLVSGPLLLLASGLALPSLSDSPVEMAQDHPAGYGFFAIAGLLGSLPLLVALLALSLQVAERMPRAGAVAVVLTFIGNAFAIADWGSELVTAQMGAQGLDTQAMEALREQVDTAPAVQAVLQVAGLATLVGTIVLAVGIARAHVGPVAGAVGLPLGVLGNIAGFASGSTVVLTVGNAIMAAAMVLLAVRWLRPAPEAAHAA